MNDMYPLFDDSIDVPGRLLEYMASSVKAFLDNRDSIKTTIVPRDEMPFFHLYVNGRTHISFVNVSLYQSRSEFRVKDMTGSFECSRTPLWFPPGFRTPRNIEEGRQYSVVISYKPSDKSTFLKDVTKFGPGEGEQDLERTVDGMLELVPQH